MTNEQIVKDRKVINDPALLPSMRGSPEGRLVIVERLAFRQGAEQPVGYDLQSSQPITSEQKPYTRQIKVGPDWMPLDPGWLIDEQDETSLITLRNDEGKFLAVNPTKEERKRVDLLWIIIGVLPLVEESSVVRRTMHSPPEPVAIPIPFAVVRPGMTARFEPAIFHRLRVKCSTTGVARMTQTLFPG